MKKLILFTLTIFLLIACGKEKTIVGRVYNPVTSAGIPNMEVRLLRSKTGMPGSVDGSGKKLLETTTTDANGNYSFTYRQRSSKGYSLSFIYDHDAYYDNITTGTPGISHVSVYDLQLIPFGYLSRNIKNTVCFDASDVFNGVSTYRHLPELSGNVIYNGCFEHYGNSNPAPMGWYVIIGTVTKNSITTPFADSIYVTAGGFHTWNIEY